MGKRVAAAFLLASVVVLVAVLAWTRVSFAVRLIPTSRWGFSSASWVLHSSWPGRSCTAQRGGKLTIGFIQVGWSERLPPRYRTNHSSHQTRGAAGRPDRP